MLEPVVYNASKQGSGQQIDCLGNARKPASMDDQREFMIVLRRALLMIVRWIERHYELTD